MLFITENQKQKKQMPSDGGTIEGTCGTLTKPRESSLSTCGHIESIDVYHPDPSVNTHTSVGMGHPGPNLDEVHRLNLSSHFTSPVAEGAMADGLFADSTVLASPLIPITHSQLPTHVGAAYGNDRATDAGIPVLSTAISQVWDHIDQQGSEETTATWDTESRVPEDEMSGSSAQRQQSDTVRVPYMPLFAVTLCFAIIITLLISFKSFRGKQT